LGFCLFNRQAGLNKTTARRGAPKGATIVKAAIYPSIGIARVGNSIQYFIGPEVTDPPPHPHGYYRDRRGALKRQAAQFRVYGLDAGNRPVAELTLPAARIQWMVHLANKKAAWYQFHSPLDVPESAGAPPALLRNARIANRRTLIIDGGPRRISGANHGGSARYKFDGPRCRFLGRPVYLGELRTDPKGRLLVLGGRGKAASGATPPEPITGAHNNETWYDDTSDGPVTARVTWKGKKLEVVPAWVVVAQPNYAPQQKSVCTMWDVIRDVAIQNPVKGFPSLPLPARPSFDRDIRPIFERLSALQWVNPAYAAAFGWHGPHHLANPEMLARLSSNSPAYQALRQTIANQFRDPRPAPQGDPVAATGVQLWPWLFGDGCGTASSPRLYSSLTPTQLQMLKVNWVQGKFDDDYDPKAVPIRDIRQLRHQPHEQAEMLTRAALEFCAADALNPGIELTWTMRIPGIYLPGFPFRIAHADRGWVEPDLGAAFNLNEVVRVVGPLGAQGPGGLTRWLALPWHSAVGACKIRRSGEFSSDAYVPTWWPSRVPNQVLTPRNYARIGDLSLTPAERVAAFYERDDWIRQPAPILGSIPPAEAGEAGILNDVVRDFGKMGIVADMDSPDPGNSDLPATMQVSDRDTPPPGPARTSRRRR